MTAETVIVCIRATGSFTFTELDDEKMPTNLGWHEFRALVEDGTFEPRIEVEVIRENKAAGARPWDGEGGGNG
jgi:hypothetical protein